MVKILGESIKCPLQNKYSEHTGWTKAENETSDQKPVKSSPAGGEKDPGTDSKDTTEGELKVSTKTADSILTAIDEILGESKLYIS